MAIKAVESIKNSDIILNLGIVVNVVKQPLDRTVIITTRKTDGSTEITTVDYGMKYNVA